jgi:MFS-type transporter involved in bile tolerance (Atg22 family)
VTSERRSGPRHSLLAVDLVAGSAPQGLWLVTSVYLVVDADLSASQLVLIGVAQGVIALVFEVPTGVVADSISRKWSLVVSHVLMGTGMIATS